ncbi:hypothetical protein Tco_0536708 [Tanacetum coccineum]
MSGNPTPSSDSVIESLSPSPIPYGDSDSLMEETDTLLSHFNDSSPDYETFCFDIEEKSSGSTTSHSDHSLAEYESFHFDLFKDDEPSTTKSLIEKPFDIDKEIYDYEGDILFLEKLLNDEPSKAG